MPGAVLTNGDMLASKQGKPKISLKLVFKDDVPAGGLLFTFTGTTKEDDRKTVQDILIPFVSVNKGVAPAPAAVASPVPAVVSTGGSGASTPGTPGALSAVQRGKRKAEDSPAPLSEAAQTARKAEQKLKIKVLGKNPNLKLLHRELVMGGQISEKEFWEGREVGVSLATGADNRH
jgi:transcription initiation factor TFIIH subunit 1